jgi:hypothetical protein
MHASGKLLTHNYKKKTIASKTASDLRGRLLALSCQNLISPHIEERIPKLHCVLRILRHFCTRVLGVSCEI